MISIEYFFYLTLIVLLYYNVKQKIRLYILFISSLLFIGYLSVTFLLFAFLLSSVNYLAGILMNRQEHGNRKKHIYYFILFIDIGSLLFFKYSIVFVNLINSINEWLNIQSVISGHSILLPIGISYYTFQSIGYIYRVYKAKEHPEKNYLIFTIYTLFFPKLLAGPIEKSNHFLPQIHNKMQFERKDFVFGLQLIMLGLLKKFVIADNIGVLVNHVNNNLNDYSGPVLGLVYIIQPLYYYFDFSGYTDIALGSARLFGFKLTDNFNRPFFALNVSSFWRRWHISLTSWCNEFIYNIVLYKRRKWKDWGAVYAVFLTFIIIGLWHGPRWNYLMVGILNGAAISFEYMFRKQRYRLFQHFPPSLRKSVGRLITYLFLSFTLIFFSLPELSDSLIFIQKVFIGGGEQLKWHLLYEGWTKIIFIPIVLLIYFIFEALRENKFPLIEKFNKLKPVYRYAYYFMLIYILIWFSGTQQDFIYFQF